MKNILFSIVFLTVFLLADIGATSPKPPKPVEPSLPTAKPIVRPIIEKNFNYRPVQHYNYTPYYYNEPDQEAQEKALAEEKKKNLALEKELNATIRAKQKALQKKNKAQYEKAMKEFDNRKSTVPSHNRIIISDEPIK